MDRLTPEQNFQLTVECVLAMRDYCTCGRRRTDEKFRRRGLVYCVECKQPFCCAITLLDPTFEPHSAEAADGEMVYCYAHREAVEVLTSRSHTFH